MTKVNEFTIAAPGSGCAQCRALLNFAYIGDQVIRLLSVLGFALLSFIVLAAEEAQAPVQTVNVSVWPMLIFSLILVGMIGGFGVYIWAKERKRKGQG
ncbi:MAG: hypothetical protein ACT4PS_17910 [Betaproteobacteria bacterium]